MSKFGLFDPDRLASLSFNVVHKKIKNKKTMGF